MGQHPEVVSELVVGRDDDALSAVFVLDGSAQSEEALVRAPAINTDRVVHARTRDRLLLMPVATHGIPAGHQRTIGLAVQGDGGQPEVGLPFRISAARQASRGP